MPSAANAKVFCIGFHKTGTSSMGVLLERLGYRVQGAYRVRDEDFIAKLARGELEELMPILQSHDAFQDNPWPVLYRELDERFPGSRFILTTRDTEHGFAVSRTTSASSARRTRRCVVGSTGTGIPSDTSSRIASGTSATSRK